MFKRKAAQPREWSQTGTLMHKPPRGWLHPDRVITEGTGVCYCVQYVGCMQIMRSMRTLRFEERTQVTREAMMRCVEASSIRAISKKRKVSKGIVKLLGGRPVVSRAGTNINLSISIDGLQLAVMETGEVIAHHAMPSISFATGGEGEGVDFVGYVAKDPVNDRACHCFDCGDLAYDVITTIGQAFELRYKSFLNSPKPLPMEITSKFGEGDMHFGFDEDEEDPSNNSVSPSAASKLHSNNSASASPERSNGAVYQTVAERERSMKKLPHHPVLETLHRVRHSQMLRSNSYDETVNRNGAAASNPYEESMANSSPKLYYSGSEYESPKELPGLAKPHTTAHVYPSNQVIGGGAIYDNAEGSDQISDLHCGRPQGASAVYNNRPDSGPRRSRNPSFDDSIYDNFGLNGAAAAAKPAPAQSFSMHPLHANLPRMPPPKPSAHPPGANSLDAHDWFHGPIPRDEAEQILEADGEFLVRESTTQAGQYVLSGMENGKVKHLLLVDPDGVVRTRDRVFETVPDLIHFHIQHSLPIVSSGSCLTLGTAVVVAYED